MGEWLPPNSVGGGRRSSKQGACAGSAVTRKHQWRRPAKDFVGTAPLEACKAECSRALSCGAIETVQRSGASGGTEHECYFIDVYSYTSRAAAAVTHVVPRPDGPSCFLKPTYAAALDRCPKPSPDCACCFLAGPQADFSSTGNFQCEDLAFGDLRGLDMWKANFEGVEMTCAAFDDARLLETTFKDAVAARASFVRAKLDRSDFDQTVLPHANFSGATLREAKLEQANLRHATFDGADLSRTSFVESDLSHATFFGAVGVATAQFDRALGLNTAKGVSRTTLAAALVQG